MGIKVAEGYVEVSADTRRMDSDLAGIGGKSSGGLMSTGLKLGGALVGGLLAVDLAGKAKDWIGGAIMAGSDLNETISKSTAIFGPQQAAISAWASTSATSIGLSTSAAMSAASGFGDMFTQIGFTGDEAAAMSTNVVQAAADLGSFSNLETADVAERISAAFRGEYDSLQAVIPNISAARVESEAMAATGKTTAASLTAQEKATAVMAIVTKDGSRAMGDFGRTSEGFANQMKIASAQSEDLKAKVGTALQPALQGMAGVLTGSVMPALLGFADRAAPVLETFFGSTLPSVLGSAGSAFGPILSTFGTLGSGLMSGLAPFTAVLGPLIGTIVGQFATLGPAVSPFGIILAGLAPVATSVGGVLGALATSVLTVLSGALSAILPAILSLSTSLSGGITAIMPAVMSLLGSFAGLLLTLAPVISSVLAAVLPLVSSLISSLVPALAAIIAAILPVVSALISSLAPALTSIIAAVLPVISSIVSLAGLILSAIMPVVTILLGMLIPAIQALMPVVTTIFGIVVSVITSAMQIVQGIIQVVTGIITGNWSQVWSGITNIVQGQWNLISSVVTGAINLVKSVITAGINLVKAQWSGAWSAIGSVVGSVGSTISGAVSNMVSGVRGGISNVTSFFTGLPGTIMGAVSGFGSMLFSSGAKIMDGLVNGIRSTIGKVTSAVGDVMSAARNLLPFSPAKEGPFSGKGWSLYSGMSIGGALADGMRSQITGVRAAATDMISAAKVPGFGLGGSSSSSSTSGVGDRASVVVNQTFTAADPAVAVRASTREIARFL